MKQASGADPVRQFTVDQIESYLAANWSKERWKELLESGEDPWEQFLREHGKFLSYFSFRLVSNRCTGACRCGLGITIGNEVQVLLKEELRKISPERFALERSEPNRDIPTPNREILTAIRNASLREFLELHLELFYRKAMFLKASRESAEDVAGDVLMNFLEKEFVSYDPSLQTLKTFLLICIENKGKTALLKQSKQSAREQRLQIEADGDVVEIRIADPSKSALEKMIDREDIACLERAFGFLTPKELEVVCLYCEEELPHKDIAKKLGCTEGTSKTRLFRARQKLQDHTTTLGCGGGRKDATSNG